MMKIGDLVYIPTTGSIGGKSKRGKIVGIYGERGVGYGVHYRVQFTETGEVEEFMESDVYPVVTVGEMIKRRGRFNCELCGDKLPKPEYDITKCAVCEKCIRGQMK